MPTHSAWVEALASTTLHCNRFAWERMNPESMPGSCRPVGVLSRAQVLMEGNHEVMLQAPSFPCCVDWLPDGRLLIVSTRAGRLLRREPDGSIVTHGAHYLRRHRHDAEVAALCQETR